VQIDNQRDLRLSHDLEPAIVVIDRKVPLIQIGFEFIPRDYVDIPILALC